MIAGVMQDNDLIFPFRSNNKLIRFMLRNKQLARLQFKQTVILFIIGAIICLALSIYCFIMVNNVIVYRYQYYDRTNTNCPFGTNCLINIVIDQPIRQPIYLLYEIGIFVTIQTIFIKTIVDISNQKATVNQQVKYCNNIGNDISINDATFCTPFITNQQMRVNMSWGNTPLDPQALASPCGAIAYTFFNDTFSLANSSMSIMINQTGISWPGDKGGKYRRTPNSSNTQWHDPQDQHFIVWMRTAGLPNFQKLWGIIQTDLTPGTYTMTVVNNFHVGTWNGDKYFTLTTSSPIGGKNYFLPVAFLLTSIFAIITILVFWKQTTSAVKTKPT